MKVTFTPSGMDPYSEVVHVDNRGLGRILWHPDSEPRFVPKGTCDSIPLKILEEVAQRLRFKASLANKPQGG